MKEVQKETVILYLLFLVITFFAFLQQERDRNPAIDYAMHDSETATECLLDDDTSLLSFPVERIRSSLQYTAFLIPLSFTLFAHPFHIKNTLRILQTANLDCSHLTLPVSRMLKKLQTKNIWHQSSKEPPHTFHIMS